MIYWCVKNCILEEWIALRNWAHKMSAGLNWLWKCWLLAQIFLLVLVDQKLIENELGLCIEHFTPPRAPTTPCRCDLSIFIPDLMLLANNAARVASNFRVDSGTWFSSSTFFAACLWHFWCDALCFFGGGESELDLQSELEYSEELSCSDSEFEQLEMGELRVQTHFLLCFFSFLCLVLVAVWVFLLKLGQANQLFLQY